MSEFPGRHGRAVIQRAKGFHGYYRGYCYLPLYIFCGGHLLCARLRPSNIDAADGAAEELDRIVKRIRGRWPGTRVVIRGDAGFCRDEIMAWCEANEVGYVSGLARNARLVKRIGKALRKSRRFRQFRYRTRDPWSRTRRVVAKAEHLAKGSNPGFVVTSLGLGDAGLRRLYEELYCARGDMENRIKERQLDMFADRTSAATLRANQLRLYFASFAHVLMRGARRLGLAGTRWANAQCGTLRAKLLKVAARVRVTARKVWLSFSSVYPHRREFAAALAALRRARARAPPDQVAARSLRGRPMRGRGSPAPRRSPRLGDNAPNSGSRRRDAAANPMPAPQTASPRFAAARQGPKPRSIKPI